MVGPNEEIEEILRQKNKDVRKQTKDCVRRDLRSGEEKLTEKSSRRAAVRGLIKRNYCSLPVEWKRN